MIYAMHVASGVSAPRLARIKAQAPTALLGNVVNWGTGDEAFAKALGVADVGDVSLPVANAGACAAFAMSAAAHIARPRTRAHVEFLPNRREIAGSCLAHPGHHMSSEFDEAR
jgi:hypothetical protein